MNLDTEGLEPKDIIKLIHCKQIHEIHEKGDMVWLKKRLDLLNLVEDF